MGKREGRINDPHGEHRERSDVKKIPYLDNTFN